MTWRRILAFIGYMEFGLGLLAMVITQLFRSSGLGWDGPMTEIHWIACSLNAIASMVAGLGLIWLSRPTRQ